MIFRKKKSPVKKNKKKFPDINPNDKVNYNENDLLDELHMRFFQSFALTLDTADYVPDKYIDKVYKRIYKVQKKMYKKIGKTDKAYQVWFKEHLPRLIAERQQRQLQEQLQQKDSATDEKKG